MRGLARRAVSLASGREKIFSCSKRLVKYYAKFQARIFHNYIIDVLRSGKLHPPNPVLDYLNGNELPSFSSWKPHHMQSATKEYRDQHDSAVKKFKDELQEISKNISTASAGDAKIMLSNCISKWDKFSRNIQELHSSASMFVLLSELSTRKNWEASLGELRLALPMVNTDIEVVNMLRITLERILEKIDLSGVPDEPIWAARYILRNTLHTAGFGLPVAEQEEYSQNLTSLNSIKGRILRTESPAESRQFLSDAYSLLEILNRNAEILGHPNYAAMVLSGRMVNEVELRDLHEATASHFLPLLEDAHGDPFDSELFLKNNVANPTIDGCLLAMSRIVSDLFAVQIVEVFESDVLWQKDTQRLFHLEDIEKTDQEGKPLYLGSIVFDPFRRPGKMKRSFVIPLRHRGENPPLTGLVLDIVPPIWSDQIHEISWDDAEDFAHEFGHALAIILSRSSIGGICGAQNLSLDLSEIMPKFMEHCLFEKSSLQYTMEFSYPESGTELTSEMIDVLLRRRGQKKAQQIMQHVFFGSLELEIFSSFDSGGDESLVGLQRRLAATYVPHDQPDYKDLSPLLEVFTENAQGFHMGMHRYFWAEVYSAGLFRAFLHHDNSPPQSHLQSQFLAAEHVQTLGRELRSNFLDLGATVDAESSLVKLNGQNLETPGALFSLYKF